MVIAKNWIFLAAQVIVSVLKWSEVCLASFLSATASFNQFEKWYHRFRDPPITVLILWAVFKVPVLKYELLPVKYASFYIFVSVYNIWINVFWTFNFIIFYKGANKSFTYSGLELNSVMANHHASCAGNKIPHSLSKYVISHSCCCKNRVNLRRCICLDRKKKRICKYFLSQVISLV